MSSPMDHDHSNSKTLRSHKDRKPPFATSLSSVPVTVARKPFYPSPDSPLANPGTGRANIAPDTANPNGTTDVISGDTWSLTPNKSYAASRQNRTVLQQHCDYWDTDHDSIIWPHDTYFGCRRFGWNPILSLIATLFINIGLSYPSCPGLLPDPFFRIYLDRIHKDKHGSDTMTYDNEGRFKPQNFEDIFSKYDAEGKGGLTLWDVWNLHKGQRMVFDFFGGTATALEWIATYLLLWPEDGIMKKEDVRQIYDGSIFYRKAEETEARRGKGRTAVKYH